MSSRFDPNKLAIWPNLHLQPELSVQACCELACLRG